MDEYSKKHLKEAKAAVSERLAAVDVSRYRLSEVDSRIEQYVREVCTEPKAHNLFEQLAVERFLHHCRVYGLNKAHVLTFFSFYEMLSFPGQKGRCTYRLTPVQAFQFAAIYGFYDSEGRRVTHTAVLFVPRKFSKTTSSAAIAIYDMLFGEANAESYTGANSQDQAKKCFDVIRGAMRKLDPKGKYYTVNEQVIKSRRADRTAFAQCLTANARTKDGLNASTVIMDEFSQARDATLLNVLTTSMGIRRNPLTVIITTASDVYEGPFYSMLQGYKRLLLGEFEDDSVFAHLFEPDVDDAEGDLATWRKVQPHLGVTVTEEFYRGEWAKAQRDGTEAMMAFRTKLLNMYATTTRRVWFTEEDTAKMFRRFRVEDIGGMPPATVAIDLSVRGDLTAVSTCVFDKSAQSFMIDTRYFFPSGALAGHPDEVLFRKWAAEGALTLLDGAVMDYRQVAQFIITRAEHARLYAIGYDRYKAREMINILSNSGLKSLLRDVGQTYGHFTAACMSFEAAALTGRLFLNDNPINRYCLASAYLDYDGMGNCKPRKLNEHAGKIDGLITALMSIKLFHELRRQQ